MSNPLYTTEQALSDGLAKHPNIYCGSWDNQYHYAIKAGKGWFPLSFSRDHIYNGTAVEAINRMSKEFNPVVPFSMTADESLANL